MKYYLFDFDGTLVDSMPTFVGAMLRILDENGIAYEDDIVKTITPLGLMGTAKYYTSLGVDMPMDQLLDTMKRYMADAYFYTIPAKKNVPETLKLLKERGASLNVLTASPHVTLDPCLKRLGLYELFDNVWSCDDFHTTKADPEIYKMAAARMGVAVEQVLFLDDNLNADMTAKQAGMQVCGVYDESSKDYVAQMQEVNDYYIFDFAELPSLGRLTMKKYLLPETGKFYKANLHCHTTVSDGSYTPEQVKDAYKNHGYSIVAYTDHNVLICQNHLTDGDFLALNGYELNAAGENGQTCHMNFIALDPDNLTQVCYHREKYLFANAVKYRDQLKFDESLPDYERVHTPEKISEMMRMGRDGGFFVVYNHPAWSMESPEQYTNYHGMHAMEIHNTSCLRAGYNDYNEKEYDHILRAGERIFCIAADDNHNRYPLESHLSSSFGGFVMIKAEKLEYKAVTDALLAGHFYASQGPEIYDLWYEDGKVHITCSPAQMVVVSGDRRKTDFVSVPAGESLTEATLTVNEEYKYFRVTVIDENGKRANTNAYFLDEVCK